MPKVPHLTPGVEEAVRRAAEGTVPPSVEAAARRAAEGAVPPSVEAAVRAATDTSGREAYTERLNSWRPKVKVVNWQTLRRAVKERALFAWEWTDWHIGTPSGRPVPGSRALWEVDGANAVARELRDAADLVLREAALEARKEGETWTLIAEHLNITKSAAIARYGRAGEQ